MRINMSPTRRLKLRVLFICLALGATPALARTSRDALSPPEGKLCQDLFLAINRGDLAGVRSLLARGADPNARNSLELTPMSLAAASGQVPVVQALLHAGAKPDAPTIFGTPLTFAALGGATPVVKLLLARGANAHAQRPDGIAPLMLAARGGDPEMLQELLRRKAVVNARDGDGATALIYAAREGHVEIGRLLLGSGAAVDAVDSHGWTALMYASVNGHADFVKLLLGKGANPNVRDPRGRTPLLLAATYGDYPSVLGALAEGGADLRASDAKQDTALALAAARGHAESAAFLRGRGVDLPLAAGNGAQRTPGKAVQVSLAALQRSMRAFSELTGCISCHQDGLGRMATGAAREHGFAIDQTVAEAQSKRIAGALTGLRPLHLKALQDPSAMKNVPLVEIGDIPPGYGYLLAGLAAHKQPANPAISAAAMVLARQQFADGHWQFSLPRVPMQSSYFTVTTLAIQAMHTYAPSDRTAEVAKRIRRGKTWLLSAPAKSTDDMAFRLLGLKSAGASRGERRKAIDALRATQQPDGGWSQLASLQSDAYATGQALYALNVAGGLAVSDPVYRQGVQFLLRTQEEDGTWFVNKRAVPLNNYFDAAFPHGQSQYASFNATCWAMMALLQTIDRPHPVVPQQAAR
jgi:ankyrin repeat protein